MSNDEHSISSDAAADLTQDGDSMDSEREALNLVSGREFSSSLFIVIRSQVGLKWLVVGHCWTNTSTMCCEAYARMLVTFLLS